MRFETLADFIHMGGHGVFVWSAYFLVLLVFTFNIFLPLYQNRQVRGEIRNQIRRETARKQAMEEGA